MAADTLRRCPLLSSTSTCSSSSVPRAHNAGARSWEGVEAAERRFARSSEGARATLPVLSSSPPSTDVFAADSPSESHTLPLAEVPGGVLERGDPRNEGMHRRKDGKHPAFGRPSRSSPCSSPPSLPSAKIASCAAAAVCSSLNSSGNSSAAGAASRVACELCSASVCFCGTGISSFGAHAPTELRLRCSTACGISIFGTAAESTLS
eukprot:2806069-Rhodomonas_salina.2